MGVIGCGTGILAAIFFFLGLIPFLGWINWFTTLPLAVISAAMAYSVTKDRHANSGARVTLAASVLLILITLVRLSIGGGFI